MEDDDEFGDLYSDVLVAPATAPPNPSTIAAAAATSRPDDDDDEQILHGSSRPFHSHQPAPAVPEDDGGDDWMLGHAPAAVDQPENWDEDEDDVPSSKVESRVLAVAERVVDGARVSEIRDVDVAGMDVDQKESEIEGMDEDPVIPGLSAGPVGGVDNGGGVKPARSDDWDSDSEDDLQIVLNDDDRGPMGGEMGGRMGDDDDEDGEEDLVIVTDEDQHHHHHQGMEEQEWGEEVTQVGADGERKEGAEGAKGNGVVGGVAQGARIGYSNHGFHPQHHSMYKYVRPGAAPATGGPMVSSIGAPGQTRPPLPIAGRGRGDWRPIGPRGVPAQKGFFSGPVWNNSSARAFGGGLDFTLPSHKTVFDVDIDGFEEKPWKHPGIDISDFFNFGLDEDTWKNYCKQLDQFRLEATMQSKIRVYESGRSEQDYDPDLPPELAAATGLHDVSAGNLRGTVDGGEADLNGQGRGGASMRPPIPTGRAIQVEGGYGERLPSIDTRPPRIRDSDSIIEIVCQDAMDESNTYSSALGQPEYDPAEEQLKGIRDFDGYPEYPGSVANNFTDRKRQMVSRSMPFTPDRNGILSFSSEASLPTRPHSKSQGPESPSEPPPANYGGRLQSGRRRHSSTNVDTREDTDQNATMNRSDSHQDEKLRDSQERHGPDVSPAVSPAVAAQTTRESSLESGDYEHDDRIALGESIDLEGEENQEIASDSQASPRTLDDDDSVHSAKKQKLSSRVEQPTYHGNGEGGTADSRMAHSVNSRGKPAKGKEYLMRHEGGEEVVHDVRSRRISDVRKRHEEEERDLRRRDDYGRDGRQEMEKGHIASRGWVDTHHAYPHRELDSYPLRSRSEASERLKDRENPSDWQRREDEIHVRRIKGTDTKRERVDEAGMRHRDKVRPSDRKYKDEDVHLKRRVDDGDWRSRDREGSSRQREREDMLLNRRDNLEDPHIRRRKGEEHLKRDKVDKEDLHVHRSREDIAPRKREREDGTDHRRRDDAGRTRDRPEDLHSVRHKDENWHLKEREDRHRHRHQQDDLQKHREREEAWAAVRNGRVREEKPVGRNVKTRDESKAGGSDKDSQQKDRRRHNDLPRIGDRPSDESKRLHKGREDILPYVHELSSERSSRRDRSRSNKDRALSASDGQMIYRERPKEGTRKTNYSETADPDFQGAGRANDEHSAHQTDKDSTKGSDELENKNYSGSLSKLVEDEPGVPQLHRSSAEHGADPASDDESHHDSRRGRSKMERWSSHKERDYSAIDNTQSSSFRGEFEGPKSDREKSEELSKTEGNNAGGSDPKIVDASQASGRNGDDHDRHLDTVAKLKRRSERFKLPMPGEKETPGNKKAENETHMGQNEIATDTEIKPERPPRKRRWVSS